MHMYGAATKILAAHFCNSVKEEKPSKIIFYRILACALSETVLLKIKPRLVSGVGEPFLAWPLT